MKRIIQRDQETAPDLSQAEPGPSTPRQHERTPCSVFAGGQSPLTSPSPSPSPTSPIPAVVARARSPEGATPAVSAIGDAAPPSSTQAHHAPSRLTRSTSRSSIKNSPKVGGRSSAAAIEARLKSKGGTVTRFGEQVSSITFVARIRVADPQDCRMASPSSSGRRGLHRRRSRTSSRTSGNRSPQLPSASLQP